MSKSLSLEALADTTALLAIFILTFSVFWFSPNRQLTDSNYSMLLSESLLHHRSFMLDGFAIPRLKPTWHDNTFKNGEIYQLEIVGPHLYYYLPPGGSLLSLPYVALMNAFGVSAANTDGSYNPEGEQRIEAGLATVLMALLSCILFLTARLFLPITWSTIIALGTAFGTQVWSTASRALWSDTWAIFLLAISLYLLLSDAAGKRKLNPFVLATLLAWTYFVRPTNAISILGIAVYIYIQRRALFPKFVLTGLAWLAVFMTYSWIHFHQLLPKYFSPGRLSFGSFGTAFAGNLISPSRGLFIFVPVLLFIAYLAITNRTLFGNKLAIIALPVIVLHLIAVAGFVPWNGGFSYGPRYTTGLVPWFALLAILSIREYLNAGSTAGLKRTATFASGAVLLVLSVFINSRGATSYEAWMWNVWPDNVDKVPQKIWDWRRPQFLAGLVAPPPANPLPVLQGRVYFGVEAADSFAWYGWSQGEKTFRWSDGKEAAIVFTADKTRDANLILRMGAFIDKDRLRAQNVSIFFNDALLLSTTLNEEPAQEFVFPIDRNLLREQNSLVFKLPDAASPKSLGISSDQRRLAIRIEWLDLSPRQP
jgi:hypothetical protein